MLTSKPWMRGLAWAMLLGVTLMLVGSVAHASEHSATPAATSVEETSFFWDLVKNLFNSKELMRVLSRPEYQVAAFIALNLIVFVETGLLIGFFLPGDSLLVTAGIVCYSAGWNLPLLLVTLCVSAIVGDSLGYSIGFKTGPKIFNREKSWFFNKDHLLAAQDFYVRHGGKTIILARFVPIIRTFAPVVAGVGKMQYSRFLFYNIFGGIGWVVSMILVGYFLQPAIDPLFKSWLGNPEFTVQHHVEKVIIIVVFLSILPGIIMGVRHKMARRQSAPASAQQEAPV